MPSPTIHVLLCPLTVGSYALGCVDIFSIANKVITHFHPQYAPFKVQLISHDGNPVRGANNCQLDVKGSLGECQHGDILLIPGIMINDESELQTHIDKWPKIIHSLKSEQAKFIKIISFCTSAFLLAESNLLQGLNATTAWWLEKAFIKRYPDTHLQISNTYVDNDLITCVGSAQLYQDFCLQLIESITHYDIAKKVSSYTMLDYHRKSQLPYSRPWLTHSREPFIDKLKKWISDHLSESFSIEELAAEMAVSKRTLNRRFQQYIKESPQAYIQQIRMEKARELLSTTTMPLSHVIQACGYQDESAFRRIFKRTNSLSPKHYRQQFSNKEVFTLNY